DVLGTCCKEDEVANFSMVKFFEKVLRMSMNKEEPPISRWYYHQRVDGFSFVTHRVSKLKDTIRGYSIRGSILSGISYNGLFQIEPSAGMLHSGLADDSGL
nr:hypothetical protein [Tanacetum cinerariifolium]